MSCINNKYFCKDIECNYCYCRSFLNVSKSEYWDYTNNKENPREFLKGSQKKKYFVCNICNHNFEMRIYSVYNGSWCPFCSNQKLCNVKNCIKCYEKSFCSVSKSEY